MDYSEQPHKLSREQQVQEAMEAQRLMEHPLITKFFQTAQANLFNRWRMDCDDEGNPSTPQHREVIYLQLQGLKAFRNYLEGLVRNGKVIDRELEAERKNATR